MQHMFCKRISLLLTTAATAVLMLNGCSGNNGSNGTNGTNAIATTGTVNASTFTNDNLNNIVIDGKIISASIPGKNPVVTFQVVDKVSGAGITGLKTFGLHIAKLMPEANGSSSYWVNYIDKGISLPAPLAFAVANGKAVTGAITKPSADPGKTLVTSSQIGLDLTKYPVGSVLLPGYTVVDNGDGTYTATFGSDVTSNLNAPYDANAIHRIGVTVTSIATPGVTATGPLDQTGAVNTSFLAQNRLAMAYDFTPATGAVYVNPNGGNFARDIVTTDACNKCHDKIADIGGHQAARPNTKVCVICHTNTNTSGEGEFVTFIHRIHMGDALPVMPLAESVVNPTKPLPHGLLVAYQTQTYPQDIRNCTMCHKGVDGANWQTKPNVKDCGSCHNGINFATGAGTTNAGAATGHVGGAQANDNGCILCHGNAAVTASHLAVEPPDPTSPELGGTNTHTYAGYLPAAGTVVPGAATVAWNVKSVTVDVNRNPVITFKFTKNGSDVVFNTYAAGSVTEMITGFTGSPSAYFAYAVTQDGITAPADFNATASAWIKGVWNGTVAAATATLSAVPDANGYYVLTIKNKTIPVGAVMLTGGIGYTYGSATTPLTQTDLAAYPYVAATNVGGLVTVVPNAWVTATSYTARRAIVSNDKCNACHAKLGIAPTFHSGQRNDAPTCSFCHTANKVSSGDWAINAKDAVHSLHAGGKRVNKFSWQADAGDKFWGITYPGYLRDCEQCHLAGTYDFSASASSIAVPNLLMSTTAIGTTPATISSIILGTEAVPGTYYSPFVAPSTNYGLAFNPAGAQDPTYANNLVISPIAAACFSCHDTSVDKAHMTQNGGSINIPRSTALLNSETCLVCHGAATNSVNATVPSIKAAHRWW